ncbi:hypothetical protein SUDANB108_03635 [Streptomyces sp. enrichment culture]|uniref:ScbA/BarX family gamma-butyrolactone biosynthesis protein n=1 Tax=Streptomyces sp. enrichment culture TaxID=1795815 RepID=UPI003F54944E
MPRTGPSSALTDDQTGRGGRPANATTTVVENAPQRTVTKELAHRTRETDVFPTRWSRVSDTRFRFLAHWPAAHPFFGPVDGVHQDPMIVGETLRQASMVLAHAEFGAPADTHFVMWDLTVFTDPDALLLADAAEPVVVDVVCSEIRRRGRGLAGMRTTMEFHRAGRFVARGTGSTGCTSPLAYRRLRQEQLAAMDKPVPLLPGIAPGLAGRTRPEDVVLAPGDAPGDTLREALEGAPGDGSGDRGRPEDGHGHRRGPGRGVWDLRVDTGHPVLFPRPNDHVPGMVLFEAARQAATAASGLRPFLPREMTASFARYAELHSPCRLETEVLTETPEEVTVRVTGRQDGESVFTADLTSPRPRPVRPLS